MEGGIVGFFQDLWLMATSKHEQGVYNTVCLVVLLALPLVVLFTLLLVCCHCCCCRHDRFCGCCCGGFCGRCGGDGLADSQRLDKRRKRNGTAKNEDLWISVKSGPMPPDVVGLSMV